MTTLPRLVDSHGVVATLRIDSDGFAFLPARIGTRGAFEPLVGAWMGKARSRRVFVVDEVPAPINVVPPAEVPGDVMTVWCERGEHNVEVKLIDLRDAIGRFRAGEKRIKIHV